MSELELARRCLNADEVWLDPLLVYQFESDVEAHDDDLQRRLRAEFAQKWQESTTSLERCFGKAELWDGDDELDWVPLNGIYELSWWRVDQKVLWLACAHEDRECPYLLILGNTSPEKMSRTTSA